MVVIVIVQIKFQKKSLQKCKALFKLEQDIFLMAQLKVMDGRTISNSKHFKKKTRSNKRTFYCWNHNIPLCQKTYFNMLYISQTYFENIRWWILIMAASSY